MSTRIESLRALEDNFVYVLVHGAHCAVIDPGDAEPVRRFLERHRLRLDAILCTHHHWDHVTGVSELAKEHNCPVWCSKHDLPRISGATKAVSGLERLWDLDVEILDVPGHTIGQIAFYFPQLEALFAGDTLFGAGCGRLFEGTPDMMFSSMKKLAGLPGETKVYFGHEYTLRNIDFVSHHSAASPVEVARYRMSCENRIAQGHGSAPTTIEDELKINPFLNAKSVAEFTKWRDLRNNW